MHRGSGSGQRGGGGYGSQRAWNYGGQGGQNAAHNPYVVQMPKFLEPLQETDDVEDQSILVVDTGDDRMVSPFQTWLVGEIMSNAASSINVLTERDQVMPPSSGFHLALFANYTLDGIKAVLAVSIESDTGNSCANWDEDAARALAHPAFQPFSWPILRDTAASYVDIKVYNGNEILFHWVLRGYRSDTDLTVQTQFVDEFFVREVNRGKPRLSITVAVFMGWRVSHLGERSLLVIQLDRGLNSECAQGLQLTRLGTMQIAWSSDTVMPKPDGSEVLSHFSARDMAHSLPHFWAYVDPHHHLRS